MWYYYIIMTIGLGNQFASQKTTETYKKFWSPIFGFIMSTSFRNHVGQNMMLPLMSWKFKYEPKMYKELIVQEGGLTRYSLLISRNSLTLLTTHRISWIIFTTGFRLCSSMERHCVRCGRQNKKEVMLIR